MPTLAPPLDPYNRPPEELAGYSSTSVEDGGETGTGNRPTDSFRQSLYADGPSETTVLEEFPSALTELDSSKHFLIDFSTLQGVFLSCNVVDDDGCTGELRYQYFRDSDSTWRYLDGVGGPALSVSQIGDIQGQIVALEADAKAQVWGRLIAINGDDVASPEIGHVAIHAGPVPQPLGDFFDFNPTEGSGTTISDKQGSGLSATKVGGTWVTDGVRYDHLGTFSFEYASASSNAFTMVRSSVMLYAKMPPVWNGAAGWFCGREPSPGGNDNDRHLYIDAAGNINANIVQLAGPYANKTVTGTTVFGAGDEFCICYTHDGTTLRLYVNGAEEDSIACSDAEATTPTVFYIGSGQASIGSQEPPSNGGLFGSTGTVIGRCVIANRGLTAAQVAELYAEFKAQYPGLP